MSIWAGLLLVLSSLIGIVVFMVLWEKLVDLLLSLIGELYDRYIRKHQ